MEAAYPNNRNATLTTILMQLHPLGTLALSFFFFFCFFPFAMKRPFSSILSLSRETRTKRVRNGRNERLETSECLR